MRFLVLLLVTPKVSCVSPLPQGASAHQAAGQHWQQPHYQMLELYKASGHSTHLALLDDSKSGANDVSRVGSSSSNSSGLVLQWSNVWATRRQQHQLQRQRQRLLRCFFMDLNDSSAALMMPAEVRDDDARLSIGAAAVHL